MQVDYSIIFRVFLKEVGHGVLGYFDHLQNYL